MGHIYEISLNLLWIKCKDLACDSWIKHTEFFPTTSNFFQLEDQTTSIQVGKQLISQLFISETHSDRNVVTNDWYQQ